MVVLKVSLHYKVCTGKVKKHLTKMEAHGCNSGKKIMVVCIIKHTKHPPPHSGKKSRCLVVIAVEGGPC